MSYLTHLECGYCGSTFDATVLHTVCPKCGKPLLVRYDLEEAKKSLSRDDLVGRVPSLWRYRELLPVSDDQNIVSLGEGYTPLIHATRSGSRLGMGRLFIKDEGLNPAGSFKARGLCMATSSVKELGVTEVVVPSERNAAGAGRPLPYRRPFSIMARSARMRRSFCSTLVPVSSTRRGLYSQPPLFPGRLEKAESERGANK